MIRSFHKAKVNKDVDVRFLGEGEISHSENLRFRGLGEDGVARSIKGNSPVSDVASPNMRCNGAVHDEDKDRIFYWLTDDNGNDRIVMYNLLNKQSTILMAGDMNFRYESLVLTANEINGLLFWVDSGRNNPRQLDLNQSYNTYNEDDISVIKKPPFKEPEIKLLRNTEIDSNELHERILYFATRYRYENQEYSSISFYSEPCFYPEGFNWEKGSLNNAGMVNIYNEIEVKFWTGDHRVREVDLLYREANSQIVYRLRKFNKDEEGWGDNEYRTFKFSNNKAIDVIPQEDVNALYYNVPNRPFTQELIFNRLIYGNYYEGFDLIDSFGNDIDLNYFVEHISIDLQNPQLVNEIISSSNYVEFTDLTKGTLYQFDFKLIGELVSLGINLQGITPPNYTETFYLLLSQDYASKADLKASDDFISFLERVNESILQSINHIPNGRVTSHEPIKANITTLDNWDIVFTEFYFTVKLDITPYDDDDDEFENVFGILRYADTTVREITFSRMPSLKSNRGYETCIYYYDKWNRQSTALVSDDNDIFIPHKDAIHQNKIKISIGHYPPKEAVKYKIGIKEGRLPYETIYAYEYYEDEDFRYIRLDAENKDKVKVGDKIIPKIDESGFFELYQPIDVLDIELKQEDFIKESFASNESGIIEQAGLYMKIKASSLNITYNKHHLYEYNKDLEKCQNNKFPFDVLTEPFSERKLVAIPSFYDYTQTHGDAFHTEAGGSLLGMWYRLIKRYDELLAQNTYDIPIPRGTTIDIEVRSSKGATDSKDIARFIARRDYANFLEWASEIELENHDLEISRGWLIDEDWYLTNASDIRNEGTVSDRRNKIDRLGNHMNLFSGKIYMVIIGNYSGGGCLVKSYGRLKYRFKMERGVNIQRKGLVVFETLPEISNEHIFYETSETFAIENGYHLGKEQDQTASQPAILTLDHYNAFAFGNGIESWKIRDRFINTDVAGKSISGKFRGVTVLEEEFKELHRESDLIYGGRYNDDLRYNALNAFNPSLANWKILDKERGSIQRIMHRDTNLLTFQSEKTGQVMYEKTVLHDQAGVDLVQQSDEVLGAYQPYGGEYGVSYNPESVASWGTSIYHTDKKRGVVLRLSTNGYQEISRYGMFHYFHEALKAHEGKLFGAYDPKNSEYLMEIDGGLWAFYEPENAFPTKWMYEPEFMLYANNSFFTWKNGVMYEAETNEIHGEFFGEQKDSKLEFSFSEAPNQDKVFNALSIYGNQAWDTILETNLTHSDIKDEEFEHKESFYHTYTRRDTLPTSRNLFPIGNVIGVSGNKITVNGGSDLVSVGDMVLDASGTQIGTIDLKHGDVLTLSLINAVAMNTFLVAEKTSRIEGSALRGYYLTVKMSKTPIEPIELYSVESKEFISKL